MAHPRLVGRSDISKKHRVSFYYHRWHGKKVQLDYFFNNKEIIFYSNISELADKIRFYSKRDSIRKKIAKNGKKKYFKLFNEKEITKYFIDISLGNNHKSHLNI